jgi:hypothetical protein
MGRRAEGWRLPGLIGATFGPKGRRAKAPKLKWIKYSAQVDGGPGTDRCLDGETVAGGSVAAGRYG